ncbi:hypothetical protein J4440_01105 [Candidatus Woesearchaeota archaeon]|nr:hypothetical protein [Candidatus Woesearchaeota archaeon]
MVKEFIKSLSNEQVEGEIIKTIFVSLITSFIILAIFYFFKLRYIENFIPKYGFFLFLAILSYAIILPSTRQVRAYKELACMSGMMVGMTIGMIAGLLSGFYIGATNGMFYGSIFGISIGMFFGIWNGKCCGIMGIMEGMMAGFMGGLMGAMTAIMMFNDNLKAAAIVIFIVSTFIMFGLKFMIYKETREIERQHKDSEMFIIICSAILTVITILLSVFGPRSILLQ